MEGVKRIEHTILSKYVIDTSFISTDVNEPYFETAICYYDEDSTGDWVIVEIYRTEKEARIGHFYWVYHCFAKQPHVFFDTSSQETVDFLDKKHSRTKW